jgi:hypothetical protein
MILYRVWGPKHIEAEACMVIQLRLCLVGTIDAGRPGGNFKPIQELVDAWSSISSSPQCDKSQKAATLTCMRSFSSRSRPVVSGSMSHVMTPPKIPHRAEIRKIFLESATYEIHREAMMAPSFPMQAANPW